MGKEKKSEINITNNFNAPIGQHINHVDTINFRLDGDGTFHFGMVENANNVEENQSGNEETENDTGINKDLKDELMPIFYNDEENVVKFLGLIKGMKPSDITDLVNKWVEEKLISDYGYSRKGTLWGILSKANLYSKSLQNWNRRVH